MLKGQKRKTKRIYPRMSDRDSIIRRVYSQYKSSAKTRKISFDLSLDQVESLIFERCYYCGTEPKSWHKHNHRAAEVFYNGIDRVDNSKGYFGHNVVTCCSNCNFLKHRIPMFIAEKMMEFTRCQGLLQVQT